MTSDESKVEAIFFTASEIPAPEDLIAFLDEACGGDEALRRRVEALLNARPKLGSFLQGHAADLAATIGMPSVTEKPGVQIGPYKLLQQLGEGGMGIVYMAEQTEPVERRAALKIIKPGMDTRQVIARFEAERQALAMMDHPNIAKVLDAGATGSGRPYFVMELVKGVPITQYCDERHLTPKQRLELFLSVLQAVQHAHQKGIIHRDIKPSNVLVAEYDDRPVPKVIDFGVAKATSQKLTEKTMFTEYGQLVGTLDYMSPEQAKLNQMDIDTRSDIYSLGVLLYELLTGDTPFDRTRLRSAAFEEMMRIIREEEPPKPSTRLSTSQRLASVSANRSTEPRKLSTLVRGDLDWIVMKALDKDRGRRYETSNAFATDVQRYLDNEPVDACPPSAMYRFCKFARRNKVALATTAFIAAALIVGTLVSTWQAIRATHALQAEAAARADAELAQHESGLQRQLADQNLQKAREAVDRYLTIVSESTLLDVPGLQDLRKELLQSALLFYRDFRADRTGDPMGLPELALAQFRIAEVHKTLAQNTEAVSAYNEGLKLVRELRRLRPAGSLEHRRLAGFWNGLRRVTAEGGINSDPDKAIQTLENCATVWEAFVKENPTEHGFQSDLAAMYATHGDLVGDFHRNAEALSSFDKALRIRMQLVSHYPSVAEYRADLAKTYGYRGHYLTLLGRAQEGNESWDQSRLLREGLVRDFPLVPQYRIQLAQCYEILGSRLTSAGDFPAAESTLRAALDLCENLLLAYPATALYRERLSAVHMALGDLFSKTDRAPESIKAYRHAVDLRIVLLSLYPDRIAFVHRVQEASSALVRQLEIAGRRSEIESVDRQVLSVLEQVHNELPNEPTYQRAYQLALAAYQRVMADRYHRYGLDLISQKRPEEAEKAFRHTRELYEMLPGAQSKGGVANMCRQLGMLLEKSGRLTDAEKEYHRSAILYGEAIEAHPENKWYPEQLAAVQYREGRLLAKRAWALATRTGPELRDPARAVELAQRAAELSPLEKSHWRVLGVTQYRAGDQVAAIKSLRKSIQIGESGDAFDFFFLAMAHWQLGEQDKARQWYDQAVAWMEKNKPDDAELLRFRQEAEELLGITEAKVETKK